MKKVTVDELKPGMKLAKDIILSDGRFLLLKGFTLKERYLEKIRMYDIPYIYVENEIEKVEYFNEEIIYSETLNTVKNVMKSVRDGGSIDVGSVKSAVSKIIQGIYKNDNVFMRLSGIRDFDNYTYLHSVDVCIYSIIAGKSLNLSPEMINNLALGAILHDIGKCKIPLSILNKPAKLSDSEFEIMKKHSEYGYDIIMKTPGLNGDIAKIALNHHEHWNGDGYPKGLKEEEIDLLSRIVAIADVYDALTADRVYRKRFMPHQAVEYLISNSRAQFDPKILNIFMESIAVYPPDIIVMLSTGEIGKVVQSKGPPSIRPKIMVIARKGGPPVIEPYEVDLAKNPQISVVDII